MLTMGTRALRALCRFASALPRPQPRCNRVAAGLPARHARVSVSSPRGHALEQAQHPSHVRVVERGHEVHLRGAGIGKTGVNAGVDEGLNQSVCAVAHGPRDSTTCAEGSLGGAPWLAYATEPPAGATAEITTEKGRKRTEPPTTVGSFARVVPGRRVVSTGRQVHTPMLGPLG